MGTVQQVPRRDPRAGDRDIAEICQQRQPAAVAEPPAHQEPARSQRLAVRHAHVVAKAWGDLLGAQPEEASSPGQTSRMLRLVELLPVQPRSDEGCRVERIRDLFDLVEEGRELATAPVPDCLGEIALEVGKVEELGTRLPIPRP